MSRLSARLAEVAGMSPEECEVILLKEPNAPEILAMLGDIETRLQAAGHAIATTGSKNGLIAPNPNGAQDGGCGQT